MSTQHTVEPDDRLITLEEAARRLGVSHELVRRRIHTGQLPVYRIGHRTVRIRESDLQRFIAGTVVQNA